MSSDSLRNNNEKFWLYSPCAKKLDVESGEFRDATIVRCSNVARLNANPSMSFVRIFVTKTCLSYIIWISIYIVKTKTLFWEDV